MPQPSAKDPTVGPTDGEPIARRDLELLATVKGKGEGHSRCFGNVLELSATRLLLEASRAQQAGESLVVSLIFPGQRARPNPIVSLGCTVRTVRDAARLHYELDIDDLEPDSRELLEQFLGHSHAKAVP